MTLVHPFYEVIWYLNRFSYNLLINRVCRSGSLSYKDCDRDWFTKIFMTGKTFKPFYNLRPRKTRFSEFSKILSSVYLYKTFVVRLVNLKIVSVLTLHYFQTESVEHYWWILKNQDGPSLKKFLYPKTKTQKNTGV